MTKPPPAHSRTTNWPSDTAALRQRGPLLIWLNKAMTRLALHEGRPGRSAVFSDAAIRFCPTIKAPSKLPLRQIEPWERHWLPTLSNRAFRLSAVIFSGH